MNFVGSVRLRLVGFVPWSEHLPSFVADDGPPAGSSAIEIADHQRLPTRTRIEIAAGSSGLVGRIIDPGGKPRRLVARYSDEVVELIDVDLPPLAVAPATQGLWVLSEAALIAVSDQGTERLRVKVAGTRILSAGDGAIWVLASQRCWFVSAVGAVAAFDTPWRDPFDACSDQGSLTGWDRRRPNTVVRIRPDGSHDEWDVGFAAELFERPLMFGRSAFSGAALRTLIHRDSAGDRAVTVVGVGLTSDGAPYLAGVTDSGTWLWRDDEPAQRIRGTDGEQVVAVEQDRFLTWSGQRAQWCSPTSANEPPDTADATTVTELGWAAVDPYPFVAASDGEILVSTSGPTGVAVIGLRWPADLAMPTAPEPPTAGDRLRTYR